MRRLKVRSLETERPVQLGHQALHPLACGDYDLDISRRLGHPPHGQGGFRLAVLAEERRVADDAVHAAFEVGCARHRVSLTRCFLKVCVCVVREVQEGTGRQQQKGKRGGGPPGEIRHGVGWLTGELDRLHEVVKGELGEDTEAVVVLEEGERRLGRSGR